MTWSEKCDRAESLCTSQTGTLAALVDEAQTIAHRLRNTKAGILANKTL
jgi:hypothetical protein